MKTKTLNALISNNPVAVFVKKEYKSQSGLKSFLYKGNMGGWIIAEYRTGLLIGSGNTIKKAESDAETKITEVEALGTDIVKMVDDNIVKKTMLEINL